MIRVALRSCKGKGNTYIVIPRVVESESPQNEHGQGNEETIEAHRFQINKGGHGSKREERIPPKDL